jgi:hypothetical protein
LPTAANGLPSPPKRPDALFTPRVRW